MPEHVHLLLWPRSTEFRVSRFLSTVKQSVSKRAGNYLRKYSPQTLEKTGGSYHFWQDGPGYDRNLWSSKYVWETIDYIHANPVRRGLSSRPEEWEWSSAGIHAAMRDGPLGIDTDSLPDDTR